MTAAQLPAPPARSPAQAMPRLDASPVLFALGVMTPLGVFSTVTIGDVPVSILWFAAGIVLWAGSLRVKGINLLYLLLALVMVAKIAVGGSVGTAAKFLVGVVFLLSLNQVTYREGQHFFRGLNMLIPVSVAYACYQWFVFIVFNESTDYGATLPIELWNSKGWHVVLPDAWGLPRASAFMFEPAYFAMILDAALAGEMLYRQGRVRPLLVGQILFGLVLANSRVGLLAALLVMASAWLVRTNRVGLLRTLAVLAAAGPLLPLLFITNQLIDFTNNRDVIDISVFARYISFAAFAQEEPKAILFGVMNYHDTFLSNPIFVTFSDLLEGQGSDMDPKSFLASNLFQFGVVGSIVFYAGQIWLLRRSAVALAMLASINIIFFNVYAYSWPLYWIMICLTLLVGRMAPPLRRARRATRSTPPA